MAKRKKSEPDVTEDKTDFDESSSAESSSDDVLTNATSLLGTTHRVDFE